MGIRAWTDDEWVSIFMGVLHLLSFLMGLAYIFYLQAGFADSLEIYHYFETLDTYILCRKPMQEPIEDFSSPGDSEFVECSREKLVPCPRAYVVYGFCLEVLNIICFGQKLGHFYWYTRRNLTPIALNPRMKFPRVNHH